MADDHPDRIGNPLHKTLEEPNGFDGGIAITQAGREAAAGAGSKALTVIENPTQADLQSELEKQWSTWVKDQPEYFETNPSPENPHGRRSSAEFAEQRQQADAAELDKLTAGDLRSIGDVTRLLQRNNVEAALAAINKAFGGDNFNNDKAFSLHHGLNLTLQRAGLDSNWSVSVVQAPFHNLVSIYDQRTNLAQHGTEHMRYSIEIRK